jgi:N-dimethylarginine dimethylaminohydrolase
MSTSQSETSPLRRVLLKHAREAFGSDRAIAGEWRDLNFTAAPDLSRAIDQYDRFVELVSSAGAAIEFLPASAGTGMDSMYVRDASVITDRGAVLCRMGKPQRRGEPGAQEAALRRAGVPVLGTIEAPGLLEGGDVVWLDAQTIAVGRGYRSNTDGIRQLHDLAGDHLEVIAVSLPHWRGPSDVFHLMSIISPVDSDLAVVYSPLMSVPFRERLLERGMTLIDVPDAEFDSMGTNVLAIAPRKCVMVSGNPRTRAALERAGAEVLEYDGTEISLKGGGGPTCLTRPLLRDG